MKNKKSSELIVIGSAPEVIDINGIKYVIKEKERSGIKIPKTLMAIAQMAMFLPIMNTGNNIRQKGKVNVNLIDEFALIQLKVSKLSRVQRDYVEIQFNKKFIKL